MVQVIFFSDKNYTSVVDASDNNAVNEIFSFNRRLV